MPSKIKVLQVIPKLGFGGAETGCYDIAHYLYEKDCISYIVTSGGDLLKFVELFFCTLCWAYFNVFGWTDICQLTRP